MAKLTTSKRFFYIPENNLKNLKSYKYSGVDLSFISKYVLNPFWNWLVTLFPLWIAPNLITLIGLCFMILATITTLMSLENIPPFIFLLIAICISTYLNMDAIDGKQARRTGTSSPLGELFDHGCDAVNLMLMNVLIPVVFNYPHSSFLAIGGFICSYLVFYTSTWEEYHTGVLYLDYISGPSEGAWFVVFSSWISFFFGASFWDTQVFGFQIKWIVPLTFIFGGLSTSLTSVNRAYKAKKSIISLQALVFQLIVPSLYSISCLIMALLWIPEYPSLATWFIFASGLPACFRISSTILAHITKQTLRTLYPIELVPLALCLAKFSLPIVWKESTFRASVLICFVSYLSTIILIIIDICTYLDINCLSIKHEKQK